MKIQSFYHRSKEYKIYILEQDGNIHLSNNIASKFSELYYKCFGVYSVNISDMLNFVKNRGLFFFLTDHRDEIFLFFSVIKNKLTKCIEIYNICKNFNNSPIPVITVLDTFLRYFIPGNPFFKNYHNIRLSVKKNSTYLIPATILYCNLGFKIEDQPQPMAIWIDHYFTMIRKKNKYKKKNYINELRKILDENQMKNIN